MEKHNRPATCEATARKSDVFQIKSGRTYEKAPAISAMDLSHPVISPFGSRSANRATVKALDCLSAGLAPFVERELKAIHGDRWQEIALDSGGRPSGAKKQPKPNLSDPQVLLGTMWNQWNNVFARTLGPAERSLVSELRDVRNRWAHNEAFGGNDAYRALDSASRLLTAVSAPEAAEVEQMRMDLLRLQFEEQRRSEMRKASFQPTEGKPQGGLKPWREVVTPHAHRDRDRRARRGQNHHRAGR